MKYILLFTCFFMSFGTGLAGEDGFDAREVVARSDQIRNPPGSFKFVARIDEFIAGRKSDSMAVNIYTKPESTGGQYNSLVMILSPKRDQGKLILRNGNALWFFDPSAARSVRISPQQRLLGQASNGDVMTTNFAMDYRSTALGVETVTDGNRQQRDCYHIGLYALNNAVSYPRVEYWVDKKNSQPVKGRFFADSGRLLKTVFYRRFEHVLDEQRPTEVLIIDGVDNQKVTRMQFSLFEPMEIPDQWYERDYLPRFKQ